MWFFLLALAQEPAERVVAVVEDELVLASEVDLDRALTGHDTQASRFFTALRRTPEDNLVDAAVLRAEASDIALYQPDDAEIGARALAIRQHVDRDGDWQDFRAAWGLSDELLAAWVRKRLVVERYLTRNLAVSATEEPERFDTEVERHVLTLRARTRIRRVAPVQP